VDRSYVEYRHNSNSDKYNDLPMFFRALDCGLKKLKLTNWCGVADYLELSSIPFPSSLTHLSLIDVPASIREEDFDGALKSFKNLIYLEMRLSKFGYVKHRIDLAYLSPEIRYLNLRSTYIKCSSPCEFNNLSVLCLTNSRFEPFVNVSFMFKNIKECYFREFRQLGFVELFRFTMPLFTGLYKWLDMDSLEYIFIRGYKTDGDDAFGEILSTYGVPPNFRFLTLKKNVKEWKFVSQSEESAWETFMDILREGWMKS